MVRARERCHAILGGSRSCIGFIGSFFLGIVFVESRIIGTIMRKWPTQKTYRSSFIANLCSYSLLALYPILLLTVSQIIRPGALVSRTLQLFDKINEAAAWGFIDPLYRALHWFAR